MMLETHSPVEIFNAFLRDCGSLSLQHLCSELCQMITFTANQLLGRDLHVAHQAATGRTLLCKGAATLRTQTPHVYTKTRV